jgi:hypothetical protein
LIRGGEKAGDFGNGVARLAVSELHASSPGGRPSMRVVGAGRQRAAASLRLPALVVRHPQRFPLRGLPAVW